MGQNVLLGEHHVDGIQIASFSKWGVPKTQEMPLRFYVSSLTANRPGGYECFCEAWESSRLCDWILGWNRSSEREEL